MEVPAVKLTSDSSSRLNFMSSSNSNQMAQHPLEAISTGLQAAMSGEQRGPRASYMASANEGPAEIIGKVSGAVMGGEREDDGPYFTNNEGTPFLDS
jgi:catalase